MAALATTIKEIAALYGVTYRTLRFYEEAGLLNPVRAGTSRVYTARDRVRLELILKGRRLGFSLREIARIIGDDCRDYEEQPLAISLTDRLQKQEIANQIERLEGRRNDIVAALNLLSTAMQEKTDI